MENQYISFRENTLVEILQLKEMYFYNPPSLVRRMACWKKVLLYITFLTLILYIPSQYTELTIPAFTSFFIVLISFRIIWKRKQLSEMRLSILEVSCLKYTTCSSRLDMCGDVTIY